MTVHECIAFVDGIEPNGYTNAQKAAWLSECEGMVYTSLFLMSADGYPPIVYDEDRTLALPPPYDRLYPRYLQAMIHYANGEYKRYANSQAAYNEVWAELNRWFGGYWDVSDRLRGREFSAEIPADYQYHRIINVPERCAVVGCRIVVRRPWTRYSQLRHINREEIPAYRPITYLWSGENDTWYEFTLSSATPAGTVFTVEEGAVSYRKPGVPIPLEAYAASTDGPEGYVMDFRTVMQAVFDGTPVGAEAELTEKGSAPSPMLVAGEGGAELGVDMSTGYIGSADEGRAYLAGRILIPQEVYERGGGYGKG